jgi:hypothetical protein
MSDAILITNLVLGSVQLIVTALLHLRIKAECCSGKDSIDIEPVNPPDTSTTPVQFQPIQLQPIQLQPIPINPLQPQADKTQ